MKESFNQYIEEYKEQMKRGNIPKAYKGLMEYIMNLRTHFINQHSTDLVVGNLYRGYMDITYFPITPKSLKEQKLKMGLVFNHPNMKFEIWLVGQNKQTQKKYWTLFKGSDWKKYPISLTPQSSIMEHVLIENPDFSQLDSLTEKIENGTLEFIKDITNVLE